MTALKTRPTRPALSAQAPGGDPNKPRTIGDFIVEQIRSGVDPVTAAGVTGATPQDFMSWMREGAAVYARLDTVSWEHDLTADQQDLAVFYDQVIRARSHHIANLSVISEQLARGTLPPKTITRTKRGRDASGNLVVLEEHTVVESRIPDRDMLQWKLEKLEPAVYGAKATLNVTVVDLTDSDAVGEVLEARLTEVAAALGFIDATATDASEGDTVRGNPAE